MCVKRACYWGLTLNTEPSQFFGAQPQIGQETAAELLLLVKNKSMTKKTHFIQ